MSTLLSYPVSRALEDKFIRWAKPPSDTEETKAERAANMIQRALSASEALKSRTITVYGTGSFWNRTNVPSDSDVDTAVVCTDVWFCDYPTGLNGSAYGHSDALYTFAQFRREVHEALYAKFGAKLDEGNKCFKVPENTYHLNAEVTPFFEYRRYALDGSHIKGVRSFPRSGPHFTNWHKDHHTNAIRRNDATGRRFKRIVRIFKRLRGEMLECGTPAEWAAANSMASFLLECLVFNAHDVCFSQNDTYVENTRRALYSLLMKPMDEMWEVNCRKRLFGEGQSWTPDEVKSFVKHAIAYLDF